jgi:lipopolysaccharide/colanic/teichoic acid biosynthesis glycosyltransferase
MQSQAIGGRAMPSHAGWIVTRMDRLFPTGAWNSARMNSVRWSVRVLKRTVDITGALVGLTLSLPLFPVIGAALYVDCPGPLFYRQRRAGRLLGRSRDSRRFAFAEFEMYKFRTMRLDAERNTGPVLAEENDPRVTRVGRFLRRSRLDELPQLWNVLRGDMSLVGPRPERPEILANLAMAIPFFEERMRDVKPGLTGLAQVSLGYTGSIPEGSEVESLRDTLTNPFGLEEAEGAQADDMRVKLLYDLAYISALEKLSSYLRMELGILLKTPLVMLCGRGR